MLIYLLNVLHSLNLIVSDIATTNINLYFGILGDRSTHEGLNCCVHMVLKNIYIKPLTFCILHPLI